MTIKIISNYNINDIKNSINYFLDKASYEPEVREFALQITSGNPDKISSIYDWIQQNVEYVRDPIDIELFTSPIRMIREYKEGKSLAEDCDGMAILATALYRSLGIESNVVILDMESRENGHAICRIKSDKLGLVDVDPTDKDHPLGWNRSYISRVVV